MIRFYIMFAFFPGHAKLMVSLLQDVQDNDQRMTMLQLIDKMKTKHKELGGLLAWFTLNGLDEKRTVHSLAFLLLFDDKSHLGGLGSWGNFKTF